MEKLTFRLCQKKGETLLESLTSLLIFGILFAVITMMLQASFKISDIGADESAARRNSLNKAILGEYDGIDEILILQGDGISASVEIEIYDSQSFVSFKPKE